MAAAAAARAAADQASQPGWPAAGGLDAGTHHTCALLADARVRCWGFSGDGQLGYGNTNAIGDDETPASVGPVDLGAGRTATAVSAGDYHTCALLDDGSVRCWGFGADGRLGYGNVRDIGDDETPGSVAPVDLGLGRTAKAISAGGAHTCALLDDGTVRCWGYGFEGQLGDASQDTIGDNETPGSVAPVDLGLGRTAKAISAGGVHTCALLDNGTVRCWGNNSHGELGYGNTTDVGDDETPAAAGPVNLGNGRTATAISAGGAHTCALLDDATVRCWGFGSTGQLGHASSGNIGDTPATTPDKVGPVDLGPGRSALAISAGGADTCARLDDGSVRCWGYGGNGRLGYGNTATIGDDETPGTVGPVDLGPGRKALAISPGQSHTCARLDDGSVRCWGNGGNGRLGYCNQSDIGDDEAPGTVGPVDLGSGGARCASPPAASAAGPASAFTGAAQSAGATRPLGAGSDVIRARGLRSCLAAVARRAKRESARARRGSPRQRARTRLRALTRRTRCLRRYARTPGPVAALRARALGKTHIELSFNAPGTDGDRAPPARGYVVKQSRHPIRTARDFGRAHTLCRGSCRLVPGQVGGKVSLTVTDLRSRATYYYAVAARDNVSGHRGPRSATVRVTTS